MNNNQINNAVLQHFILSQALVQKLNEKTNLEVVSSNSSGIVYEWCKCTGMD